TGEIASALVTLKTADGSLITGREVTLVVDPADNLRMVPTVVTNQDGQARFKFTSSQPGIRMITASVGEVRLDASVAVIFSGDALDALPFIGITWQKDGAQMMLIPAGSFEMGDHFDEGREDGRELPVHRVGLDGFYMDAHEVTVGQFREFVNQSGYKYGGNWDSVAK
ncbi:MAG: SUMF1/EgtB/PvdO family nonheme iron enzyme, partial [Candidatus Poribacteria bacterium]|nr:SUMF1/EgtB/PvdO family nonheme iron enzyme [Candidatus Poribacteria bacterium]